MATQITLPRDAEGREIPLDTKVLYDARGTKRNVRAFMRFVDDGRWRVFFVDYDGSSSPDKMCLTPPDSWEKLLDDLNRAANGKDVAECLYMHREGEKFLCTECRLFDDSSDIECSCLAYADIAARIRKLRG
nr:MAG TPA: hypothetical protein [Caudoviricetes sp.]